MDEPIGTSRGEIHDDGTVTIQNYDHGGRPIGPPAQVADSIARRIRIVQLGGHLESVPSEDK